jgi:enoyl-CoA hydratase/carnithine racemase
VNTTLVTSFQEGVATVALNRPQASNAINHELRAEFITELLALNGSPEVRAIVVTGVGRSFCAGQDLREAASMSVELVPSWQAQQRAMFMALRDLDKPCVAALNGAAMGAGYQVALCADLRVAHAGVRIAQPEVKAGLASIVGSYMMTLHLGLSKNIELSLTAEPIGAEQAHALGLVHQLVPPDAVLPVAHRLALSMAALPTNAFRLTKQHFREMTQAGFDQACAAGARLQAECYASGEPQRVLLQRLGAPR